MAKVEVFTSDNVARYETPTQEIVRAASLTATTKDALGRTIKIRRIKPSLRQRLRAIAGPELSKNEHWIGEAVLAFSVVEIDGELMVTNTIRELEIVLDKLDDEGLAAVGVAYVKAFGGGEAFEGIEAVKN